MRQRQKPTSNHRATTAFGRIFLGLGLGKAFVLENGVLRERLRTFFAFGVGLGKGGGLLVELETGVELLLQRGVKEVRADRVVLDDDSEILTRAVVWAGGTKPPPLTANTGLPTARPATRPSPVPAGSCRRGRWCWPCRRSGTHAGGPRR